MAAEFARALADPTSLQRAAAAARTIGVSDAAERLADHVLEVAGLPARMGAAA